MTIPGRDNLAEILVMFFAGGLLFQRWTVQRSQLRLDKS